MPELISLPELSPDMPSGPDLGLDPRFGEMEAAARGKPEGQFGNTIEPAVPPDWKLTERLATELLAQTRDLRVMVFLAVARLHTAGLPGFASMLALIRHTLETGWEHVHPQLDPEDDNDPMPRANALLTFQNPVSVLRAVREAPLAVVPLSTIRAMQEAGNVSLPRPQPVSYRDLAIISGAVDADAGGERLGAAEARDVFAHARREQLAAVSEALVSAAADIAGIDAAFNARAPVGSGPDLSALTKLLREAHHEMQRYVPEAAPGGDAAGLGDADVALADGAVPDGRPASQPRAVTIRSIASLTHRDEAVYALDLASAFFRLHEPSSPLPLLIDRAKRLAPMPFLEILEDLAPDGLMQARMVAGQRNSMKM